MGRPQEETKDLLVVSNLGVKSQNRVVLDDVNFKVRRGTTLAIVGPNGGGKTTLFRALLGLVSYTGTIRWSDKVRIGYVPQNLIATDLPISVEEFLKLKCNTDFEACLGSVGLKKEILRRPLGSLSGGQLQRILIGWVIVEHKTWSQSPRLENQGAVRNVQSSGLGVCKSEGREAPYPVQGQVP